MKDEKVEEWEHNIFLYDKYVGTDKIGEEKENELVHRMNFSLNEICQYFIEKSSRQESFKIRRYSHTLQELIIISEKVETQIMFGFDYKGFYVSNDLSYQFHLKSANDEFWETFISLKKLGEFEITDLHESESEILKKYRKETAYNKSTLFQTISSIISQIIENDHSQTFHIEIRLDRNMSFEKIISTSKIIFDKIYKLNYLLYRVYSRTK